MNTTDLDIEPTINTSSKLHDISHTPSTTTTPLDRSYSMTEPPITPPSPPLAIPPECRHLRYNMLMQWIHHVHDATTHISSLVQLANDDHLLAQFVSALTDNKSIEQQQTPSSLQHHSISRLQSYFELDYLPTLNQHEEHIITFFSFILTQSQARFINSLQDNTFAFMSSHIHPIISIPKHIAATPADIQQVLLTWAQVTLADYINASLLPPVDDCHETWQDGTFFMALLHCHEPDCVPDLLEFLSTERRRQRRWWQDTLEKAFRRIHNTFQVPVLLDASTLADAMHVDEESIIAYLVEFIRGVRARNQDDQVKTKRRDDINRFTTTLAVVSSSPSTSDGTSSSSIVQLDEEGGMEEQQQQQQQKTVTATYSVQHVKLTKTTTTTTTTTTTSSTRSPEREEFDSRANAMYEKILQLQNRLVTIIPTRNYHHSSVRGGSTTSATPDLLESSSEAASECTTSGAGGTDHNGPRLLHPLQAGDEDLRTYERNYNTFQVTLQAFRQDEWDGFHQLAQQLLLTEGEEENNDDDDTSIQQRWEPIHHAFRTLMEDADKGGLLLANFQHGYLFSRHCLDVRNELDYVQMKMVKTTSTSTDGDIQHMELRMQKAFSMIENISDTFPDLLKPVGLIEYNHHDGDDDSHVGEGTTLNNDDDDDVAAEASDQQQNNKEAKAYRDHFDALVQKNELVRSWVEEVRVWFTEAQRIRQWIAIRTERLENIKVPEPLNSKDSPATREQVEQLNATHQVLEKEIETFNKEDMARLRAHVKALTGAGRADKDLSPADTTTIEITLTTLTSLEKLMHSLRQKSYDLNVLTQRTAWEGELSKCHTWLKEADKEVEEFVRGNARWQADEDDLHSDMEEQYHREHIMAQERLKELVIQRLLMLENKRNEFDQGQFTTTVDSFHDLEDAMTIDVPDHLEARQSACEHEFEDLFKRINFARQVVEQRLKVMDFLYQVYAIKKDVQQLKEDLEEAQRTALADDNDRDMTGRVQELHERIVQLVTATAGRIPYPAPGLEVDQEENDESNGVTREVISEKRTELVGLVDELDHGLNGLRHVLQLHKRGKQLLNDAKRLSEWADDRMNMLRKVRVDVESDTLTMDDLRRLQRDRDALLNKLKTGKENETIDVLTKIDSLLEEEGKMDTTAMDREGLEEASQYLTNAFDRLHSMLDDHGAQLEAMRKKKEDGNTYAEKFNLLRHFFNETRASLPGLKQTCGFITGQSEEQDRQRYDTLREKLAKLSDAFRVQSSLLNDLQEDVKHIDLLEGGGKTNKDEGVDVEVIKAFLNKDWQILGHDMKDLEQFTETVGQWYDRQRRLSMVETQLLAGLNESISELAKSGWQHEDLDKIEQKIQEAIKTLDATGAEIAEEGNKAKDDPLQTANYSRARDRHASLLNKAQTVQASLDALKKNANNAVALSDFLGKADSVSEQVQALKEIVGRRMSALGRRIPSFAAGDMHEIEKLAHAIQKEANGSEAQVRELEQQEVKRLWDVARALRSQGYDEKTVYEPVRRVEEGVAQLLDTIGLEKRQAAFVKKTQIHAKAARDLQTWINQCSQAITQITGDVCMTDESELRAEMEALEHKISEIQPIVRAFKAMPSRIMNGRDQKPLNLHELCMDPEPIKDAIKDREDLILSEWQQLANQLDMAKLSVQNSWRDVEIARKVKEILTLVGHLKERAGTIRVSGGFSEDMIHAADGNDLKMITTCPLSMMPTEHELFVAKAELDTVDRDIEQHLHTKLTELDTMLNNNSDSEDIFAGQRTEIAAAVRGLTDMIRMKRDAVAGAEKLETFLTVVEELEVMLSALHEVVERASPEYARIVDGLPSRADLQAMLIDLDTRYRYYEPKINELMDEAKDVAKDVISDKRVANCLMDLKDKWAQLKSQAASKRSDLLDRIGPLSESFNSRMIKDSMLGRKSTLTKRQSMPTFAHAEKPIPVQSTPRPLRTLAARTRPQSAMAPRRPPAAPTVRSTMVPRTTNKRISSLQAAGVTARPPLPPQRPATRASSRAATKTPEAYVADPKNDLDMAVGNIVNDSPYKIRVKMVPGEVGRYWFGAKNPKLAYCRILRSRMVMVRVGGGWVELSQFLRDHSLLEDGSFISKNTPAGSSSTRTSNPRIREGTLQTNGGVVTIRGGGAAAANNKNNGRTSRAGGVAPPMSPVRESRSTPFQRNTSPSYGHGIKEGNKFLVPVDGEGNQVEVRMTKARSKDTKFITPRRTR
ncbi:hypothetical protein BDA99DRAFT_565040 [Phascolomyces articulosus]|uniref:GAR domain-containing protein n=1 Tax=Phascolomyces articulosus TaxID=60185 RepID=A0AAD5JPK3_9FUNG|nr:hypothetical protein BDA99DRAFT_565040 [Phascolomyces articulosus]